MNSIYQISIVKPARYRAPLAAFCRVVRRLVGSALLLLVSLFLSQCVVAAETNGESIESFMKLKSKWGELIGSKFRLQGRVSGSTENILGLHGCNLEFRMSEKLPKFDTKKEVLEVTGELARDERTGGVYFKISGYKRLDSDDKIFERRRAQLSRSKPDGWYELGHWAIERGTFYKDTDLIDKGRKTLEAGLRVERDALTDRSVEKLKELGRKAVELVGDDLLRKQLDHEAAQVRIAEATKGNAKADELYGLALSLAREFPGCDEPLTEQDQLLRMSYLKSPVDFYNTSISETGLNDEQREARRKKLHRVMYSELVLASLKRRLLKDGSNGKSIAAELTRLLPEYANQAPSYRDLELAHRVAKFEQLSFSELKALRTELFELGRNEESSTLLIRWFTKRDEVLRKQGAEGMIELAALYHTSYDGPRDKRRLIIDLLLQAEKLRPANDDARALFGLYGFRQYEGRWITEDEIKAIENSPVAIAIREGRVINGMSPQQVEKAVGKPTTITKSITSKYISEYWVYRDARFSVKLTRPTSRTDATVVAVDQLMNP